MHPHISSSLFSDISPILSSLSCSVHFHLPLDLSLFHFSTVSIHFSNFQPLHDSVICICSLSYFVSHYTSISLRTLFSIFHPWLPMSFLCTFLLLYLLASVLCIACIFSTLRTLFFSVLTSLLLLLLSLSLSLSLIIIFRYSQLVYFCVYYIAT